VEALALIRDAGVHDYDSSLHVPCDSSSSSEEDRTEVDKLRGELDTLKTKHQNAVDESLMLRYKNSLLERILSEKGTSFKFYLPLNRLSDM
jgi:hypothetical protein